MSNIEIKPSLEGYAMPRKCKPASSTQCVLYHAGEMPIHRHSTYKSRRIPYSTQGSSPHVYRRLKLMSAVFQIRGLPPAFESEFSSNLNLRIAASVQIRGLPSFEAKDCLHTDPRFVAIRGSPFESTIAAVQINDCRRSKRRLPSFQSKVRRNSNSRIITTKYEKSGM